MFTACEAAKQSNKVACPCAADWKYRGEDYSFCADPNNGGFLWCATQTDEAGVMEDGMWEYCHAGCGQDQQQE